MRAMILAAGMGTRLKPLTDTLPKPLVPVRGRPMICYVLDRLEEAGIREVLVNVHYLADKLADFCGEENKLRKGLQITVQDERHQLLGSGGAIVRAESWLFSGQSTALFLNADTLIRPDIKSFVRHHERHANLCTLAVMPHSEAGAKYTGLKVVNEHVTGFFPAKGEGSARSESLFHFPGLYLLDKKALEYLPARPSNFSIMDKLWKPLVDKNKLGAWLYNGPYQDLGTLEDLRVAEERMIKGEFF